MTEEMLVRDGQLAASRGECDGLRERVASLEATVAAQAAAADRALQNSGADAAAAVAALRSQLATEQEAAQAADAARVKAHTRNTQRKEVADAQSFSRNLVFHARTPLATICYTIFPSL